MQWLCSGDAARTLSTACLPLIAFRGIVVADCSPPMAKAIDLR
jgi:hypothetical protein